MIDPTETIIEINALDAKTVKLIGEDVSVFYNYYDGGTGLIIKPIKFTKVVYQDDESVVIHIKNDEYLIVAEIVEFFHADNICYVRSIDEDNYVVNDENTITSFIAGYSFIIDVPTFFGKKEEIENPSNWMDNAYIAFCKHKIKDSIFDDIADTNGINDIMCEIANSNDMDPSNNDIQSKYIPIIKEYCANIGITMDSRRSCVGQN